MREYQPHRYIPPQDADAAEAKRLALLSDLRENARRRSLPLVVDLVDFLATQRDGTKVNPEIPGVSHVLAVVRNVLVFDRRDNPHQIRLSDTTLQVPDGEEPAYLGEAPTRGTLPPDNITVKYRLGHIYDTLGVDDRPPADLGPNDAHLRFGVDLGGRPWVLHDRRRNGLVTLSMVNTEHVVHHRTPRT